MTEQRKRPHQGKAAKDLNDTIRYTMWSVFRLRDVARRGATGQAEAAEVEKLFDELGGADVIVRGLYDVAGLRADADLMVWWHAATADELQDAYHRFRRTAFGAPPRAGVVADGAAPAGGVQQEPRPGVPRRRGAARLRVRLPVRALLRVVPARGRPSAAGCSPSTADGARLPRRARQHGRVASRSATTSGCWPSRPTSCTASST